MNRLLFCFLFLIVSCTLQAQGDIDVKMSTASKELSKEFKDFLILNNITSVKLGVLDVETNSGQVNELCLFVSNEFTTWLSMGNNGYTVISRQDIDKLIGEKELVQKYRTNNEKVQLIQKYKIADYLVLGTITQFTNMYRINLRIVSARKGEEGNVAAVKILTFERTDDLNKLFGSNNDRKEEALPKVELVKELPKSEPKYKIGSIQEGFLYGQIKSINQSRNNFLAMVKVGQDIFEITGIVSEFDVMLINGEYVVGWKYKIVFKVTGDGKGTYLSHVKVE